jgi:hypothetical protein
LLPCLAEYGHQGELILTNAHKKSRTVTHILTHPVSHFTCYI